MEYLIHASMAATVGITIGLLTCFCIDWMIRKNTKSVK
jgi:hypothetical protein